MSTVATTPSKSEDRTGVSTDIVLPISWRDPVVNALMALTTVIMAIAANGESNISFGGATSWFAMGTVTVNAPLTIWIMAIIGLVFAALTF